jgi:hypothetical protein
MGEPWSARVKNLESWCNHAIKNIEIWATRPKQPDGTGEIGDALLIESGSFLLLETSGDKLLLE